MTAPVCFDTLMILARPGAGKSEIIDFLKRIPPDQRQETYHVGQITEFDDFPMLWTWFEEDAILERLGHPRLHTDSEGYFIGVHLWDILTERLCLNHAKWQRDRKHDTLCHTALIEFSRGSEHGGYQRAFQYITPEVASRAAILYVNVSWHESLRKNRKRFNPNRPDSILEHGIEDQKLERLYREVDWEQVTAADSHTITIQGTKVPYAVFENEDDVTTSRGDVLAARLNATLAKLWEVWRKSHGG